MFDVVWCIKKINNEVEFVRQKRVYLDRIKKDVEVFVFKKGEALFNVIIETEFFSLNSNEKLKAKLLKEIKKNEAFLRR